MGYSCTTKAMESFDQLIIQLKSASPDIKSSNTWMKNGKKYFHEIGREQKDGAVTGSIFKIIDEQDHCEKMGTFRIEPDGYIKRFPTSTKTQRSVAQISAKAICDKKYRLFPPE